MLWIAWFEHITRFHYTLFIWSTFSKSNQWYVWMCHSNWHWFHLIWRLSISLLALASSMCFLFQHSASLFSRISIFNQKTRMNKQAQQLWQKDVWFRLPIWVRCISQCVPTYTHIKVSIRWSDTDWGWSCVTHTHTHIEVDDEMHVTLLNVAVFFFSFFVLVLIWFALVFLCIFL